MRPGQNKRMRGRNNNSNNNRRGPNPLTRSYESNGPDVKIRGTAHHVGEKYLQLARDAQSSGDPVMAESYLQHAEHYFRLIAAAQAAQHQAQFGSQRPGEAADQDEDGDDDFDSLPDRFASPSERVTPAPQQQSQPHQSQPYEQRGDRSYGDRQPYEARNGHAPNGSFGGDRSQQDRQNDRSRQSYSDRQNGQERPYQNQDRQQSQDRPNQDRPNQDRPYQDRQYQDRQYQDRQSQSQDRANQGGGQPQAGAAQGQREERASRDYDNRGVRHRRDDRTRDGQPARETRDSAPRQLVPEEQPSVGLPAFITAPTRVPVMDVAETEQPTVAAAESPATAPDASDEAGFHMRPRRRRRPKPEFAGADEGARDKEPVASQSDDGNA